jgi:hypothetical protein
MSSTIRLKEKEEKIGKGKGLEANNSTKEFVASTYDNSHTQKKEVIRSPTTLRSRHVPVVVVGRHLM